MTNEVVVIVETLRGEICEITYTMLAAGRQLANTLNIKLTALILSNDSNSFISQLGAADRIVSINSPALTDFNPAAHLKTLTDIFETHSPRIILFGNTAIGADLASGVAQSTNWPIATGCKTFSTDSDTATYTAITCGGKLIATGPLPGPSCIATLMPGGYKTDEGQRPGSPEIETLDAPTDLDTVPTKFHQYIEPPTGDIDIAKADILVSIGRGIQNQENVKAAERLAEALNGVVSASRPVVDQGWLPTTRLVGKSGKQVKPKLYLAVGISGAPEHLEGLPEADLIVAVNTDEQAPIFDVAHYGITCDALELMPALAETLGK